jgi:hypothetical protein
MPWTVLPVYVPRRAAFASAATRIRRLRRRMRKFGGRFLDKISLALRNFFGERMDRLTNRPPHVLRHLAEARRRRTDADQDEDEDEYDDVGASSSGSKKKKKGRKWQRDEKDLRRTAEMRMSGRRFFHGGRMDDMVAVVASAVLYL